LCKDKHFLAWVRLEALRKLKRIDTEKQVEEKIDKSLSNELNLKVEVKQDGKWVEVSHDLIMEDIK
jgi:predicted transcriptional regulator